MLLLPVQPQQLYSSLVYACQLQVSQIDMHLCYVHRTLSFVTLSFVYICDTVLSAWSL